MDKPFATVLVYGTLRTGDADADIVKISGRIYNLGWFPGLELLPEESGEIVTCERIKVSETGLKQFDSYEGYHPENLEQSLYHRVKVGDDYVYTYNADTSLIGDDHIINSGDWLAFTGEESGSNAALSREAA